VLTLERAKSFQGNFELPGNPDLLIIALGVCCALQQPIRIGKVPKSPLTDSWKDVFENVLTISEVEEGIWDVGPITENPSPFLLFQSEHIPYRDFLLFLFLGMGKTIAFRSVSEKRLQWWQKKAHQFGCTAKIEQFGENKGITFEEAGSCAIRSDIDENDISALLGLFIGMNEEVSFQTEFSFSHPIRDLAPHLGFEVQVKSATPQDKESDPIARRLRFMKSRKKKVSTASLPQAFTISVRFPEKEKPERISLQLPGDDVLGGMLLVAKCLIKKGSLAVGNMPLETWGTQILALFRRMGCKISVQETGKTSFGSVGIAGFQKFAFSGKKVECRPLYQFIRQLPTMIVVAAFAEGQSVFRDLEDLRKDEPDGLDRLVYCIRTLGARYGEMPDGIVMEGAREFDGFDLTEPQVASMSGAFAIAGLRCIGKTTIEDAAIIERWPNFEGIIKELGEFKT